MKVLWKYVLFTVRKLNQEGLFCLRFYFAGMFHDTVGFHFADGFHFALGFHIVVISLKFLPRGFILPTSHNVFVLILEYSKNR